MKMYRKLMWAAAAVLALVPFEARATTVAFRFETAQTQLNVSGGLPIPDTLDLAGGYDVTGIGGSAGGSNGAISGLLTAAPFDFDWQRNANVVFPFGPWVDSADHTFAAGEDAYDSDSRGLTDYRSSLNLAANRDFGERVNSVAVATIPEPATWLMVGFGFVALGVMGRSSPRRNRLAPAFA